MCWMTRSRRAFHPFFPSGCPTLEILSGRIILLGRVAVCRNCISAHVQVLVDLQMILFDRRSAVQCSLHDRYLARYM